MTTHDLGAQDPLSAKQAIRTAEAYIDGTIFLATHLRSDPQMAAFADRIRAGVHDLTHFSMRDRHQAIAMYGKDIVDHVQLVVFTAEAARQWQRHRVVYRIHHGLADALVESEAAGSIPCEVFARLPHPDPFVAFPRPLPSLIGQDDGAVPMQSDPVYTGMLVTGSTPEGDLCSTADPRLGSLNVAIAGRVHYVGQDPTYEERTLRIPITGKVSIEDMIRKQMRVARPDMVEPQPGDLLAYQMAVALLLYLCSDDREMKASAGGQRARERRSRAKPTLVDVGFEVGPKLFAARRESAAAAGTADGGTKRPHIRRAHWHTYWTGPRGQQTAEVRWLHPILVHPDSDRGRSVVIDTDR